MGESQIFESFSIKSSEYFNSIYNRNLFPHSSASLSFNSNRQQLLRKAHIEITICCVRLEVLRAPFYGLVIRGSRRKKMPKSVFCSAVQYRGCFVIK